MARFLRGSHPARACEAIKASEQLPEVAKRRRRAEDHLSALAPELPAMAGQWLTGPPGARAATGRAPSLSFAVGRCLFDGLLKGEHRLKGIDGPIQGSEIGILYPPLVRGDRQLFSSFLTSLSKRGPAVWLNDPRDKGAKRRVAEPGIKVQTIHSAKGLQYRVVIFMWTDLLPSGFPDSNVEEERRLMYVALTRPEDMLFVTCSSDSAFLSRMGNTGKVDFR